MRAGLHHLGTLVWLGVHHSGVRDKKSAYDAREESTGERGGLRGVVRALPFGDGLETILTKVEGPSEEHALSSSENARRRLKHFSRVIDALRDGSPF